MTGAANVLQLGLIVFNLSRFRHMRILDLDLDFFLDDIAYYRSKTDDRCDSGDFRPWAEKDVRDFLTSNCGLKPGSPVPGRFIEHHDEAFAIWRDLVASGALSTPFQVVHIDAHADLGSGDSGYLYLMGDLLHRSPADRLHPESGHDKMNFANYLAFAMACRWIDQVTFVTHPKGGNDYLEYYFRDGDSRTSVVEMKAVDPVHFEDLPAALARIPSMPASEPPIPFETVAGADFSDDGGYDFMILCHSPSFTPVESDALIPVIRSFMDESN